MTTITPGCRVVWHTDCKRVAWRKNHRGGPWYTNATVLQVHKRTAHVRVERTDGTYITRWTKLARLQGGTA